MKRSFVLTLFAFLLICFQTSAKVTTSFDKDSSEYKIVRVDQTITDVVVINYTQSSTFNYVYCPDTYRRVLLDKSLSKSVNNYNTKSHLTSSHLSVHRDVGWRSNKLFYSK